MKFDLMEVLATVDTNEMELFSEQLTEAWDKIFQYHHVSKATIAIFVTMLRMIVENVPEEFHKDLSLDLMRFLPQIIMFEMIEPIWNKGE